MGTLPVVIADAQTPVQTCPIMSTNKHRFAGFLIYGDGYFVNGKYILSMMSLFNDLKISYQNISNLEDETVYNGAAKNPPTRLLLQ